MKNKRVLVIPLITLVIMMALSAMAPAAFADGGDFSTDFIAAGPFTYNHDTGLGGTYDDRTISKTDGVVESLEGGDFECGDKVVYFAVVSVDAGATEQQDIQLDVGFLAEPTGQPGVGHRDLISASPNTSDDTGFAGQWQDTTASIVPGTEEIDTSGSNDELVATIAINNLDPGEVFVLRLVTELDCIFDSTPTGNLQAEIQAGRVVDPTEDAIPIGNQTVPFQSLSAISQPASVSVSVGACPAPGSPTRPVTVEITPPGSATVTITGPGGPYVVTGDGDTLNLAPGNYSWTAAANVGFILGGPTSGQFSVDSCPRIPVSASVTVGSCPRPGSATRPVTVTIDGPVTVTIQGPGGPYVVTETDTLNLPAGDYTWTAETDDQHELDVDSGEFTVRACPRLPASVTVEVGACPAPGSSTVPVTVTISPADSATVTITGPGGPYEVTGSGTVLQLPPGEYSWTATPDDEHALEVDSGEFTVQACPAIEASVLVTVAPCPPTSSATRPVEVAIGPEGGAIVTIDGPNSFQQVLTGTGATLDLAPGDYLWHAVANETFQIIGPSEGSFTVGSCVVEVKPRVILPSTGTSVPGVGTVGVVFVLLGVGMVAVSRRREPVLAGITNRMVVLERLSGRSATTAGVFHRVVLIFKRGSGRASP
jgi:LPXTG-motif cell wall-anchored protein